MLAKTSHIVLIWVKCHVLAVVSISFASTVMNHRLLFSIYSEFGICSHLLLIHELSLPVIQLLDTTELLLGWMWEVLKFVKFTNTQKSKKQTNMDFVLCWSTTPRAYMGFSGVWLICPKELCWRKLIFLLPAGITCK